MERECAYADEFDVESDVLLGVVVVVVGAVCCWCRWWSIEITRRLKEEGERGRGREALWTWDTHYFFVSGDSSSPAYVLDHVMA